MISEQLQFEYQAFLNDRDGNVMRQIDIRNEIPGLIADFEAKVKAMQKDFLRDLQSLNCNDNITFGVKEINAASSAKVKKQGIFSVIVI